MIVGGSRCNPPRQASLHAVVPAQDQRGASVTRMAQGSHAGRHFLAAALAALFIASAPAGGQAPRTAWDDLLDKVGLTRATCRFDLLDMNLYGGGERRLPFFDAMHQDPLRIPFYARITRQGILRAEGKLGPLVSVAAGRTGDGTRLDLLGDPLKTEMENAGRPGALLKALREVYIASGAAMPAAEGKRLAGLAASVPADVQRAASLLLQAELRALSWRRKAVAGIGKATLAAGFADLTAPPTDSDDASVEMERLQRGVDMKRMLVGGELLAFAMDHARAILAARGEMRGSMNTERADQGSERFRFDAETPLGRVSLRGATDDLYPPGASYLLILDTGGNDTYRSGGATTDPDHPVSLIVDVSGNDRYIERADLDSRGVAEHDRRKTLPRKPSVGSGVLGYGLVLDMGGDDVYRAIGQTQGAGAFGVGALADLTGDDVYDCHTLGQGSATFGVGVLADGAGADTYRCFQTSQGYGGTGGSGMLADFGAGNDTYEANDAVIDFAAPQSAQHNANLAQGFGYGRRADYTDGHSLAGGVGVLMDGGGANAFSCGIFGQGAGYWYGLGMLLAGPGDDRFTGQWYVQGSAAHFAVGVLDDEAGADVYKAAMNMAQGAGHDFSVGFLLDHAGDDRYEAPNLSLGGGNANGMGLFWDRAGDDTYVVRPSTTLGRGSIEASGRGSVRERNLTLGLFLDTGGKDRYPGEIPSARNDRLWSMTDSAPPPLASIRGAGLDIEAPDTPEPP